MNTPLVSNRFWIWMEGGLKKTPSSITNDLIQNSINIQTNINTQITNHKYCPCQPCPPWPKDWKLREEELTIMCYWDKKPCFRQKWPTKSTFTFYRTKNPTNTIRKSTSGSFATESSTSADAFSPPDSNSQVQIPGKKTCPINYSGNSSWKNYSGIIILTAARKLFSRWFWQCW